MDKDKKSIIGIAVCVVLLVIWYPLMQRIGWLPQRSPRTSQVQKRQGPEAPESPPPALPAERSAGGGGAANEGSAPGVEGRAAVQTDAASESSVVGGQNLSAEARRTPVRKEPFALRSQTGRRIQLTDEKYLSLDVDVEYGGVSEVRLLQFEGDDGEKPYHFGSPRVPGAAMLFPPGTEFGKARVVQNDVRSVAIERPIGRSGLVLIEEWRLTKTPYEILYRVSWRNEGKGELGTPTALVSAGGIDLPPPQKSRGRGASRFMMFLPEADVLPAGGRRSVSFTLKQLAKFTQDDLRRFQRRPCRWVAVHSKYFVFCVQSSTEKPSPGFIAALVPPAENTDGGGLLIGGVVVPQAQVTSGRSVVQEWRLYAGPKELERLEAWAPGFVSVMRLDRFMFGLRPAWMGWLARTLLRALIAVDRLVDTRWGFGWAIIAITFVIKLLFWPLTHRSTVSMRKMQKIQPVIQEIREKYKSDPQKMNRKIMETYREHNVSPFGGCLPLLLQIPVFFALFNVLRAAIELRHAQFFWVQDLSLPDTVAAPFGFPIRPFALLMAGSMFVQQRLSPTSPDPSQARMMMFMTIFFAFLFYGMPAGLTLYWTTNQVLTIVQMAVTNRLAGQDQHHNGSPGGK